MNKLFDLYKRTFNTSPLKIIPLNGAGSNRRYFRILPLDETDNTVIGVIGTSEEENMAFCNLSRCFEKQGINVPHVFAVDDDNMRYIQQDLGNISLYDLLADGRNSKSYNQHHLKLIADVITDLPHIQMLMAHQDVYAHCYPLQRMDKNSVMFDLNYFKYCFLKLSGIEFNEFKLQDNFDSLADDILKVNTYGFQYRDFQARNVMMFEEKPFYIDFQGGRCGPVHYDLVSFLWQASSDFPDNLRMRMVDVYLDALEKFVKVDRAQFKNELNLFVLFRTLQVLGAYGFRGLWERKKHFIDSIPLALKNLKQCIDNHVADKYPNLKLIASQLIEHYNNTKADSDSNSDIAGVEIFSSMEIPHHNSSSDTHDSKDSGNMSFVHSLIQNDSSYCKQSDKPLVVRVYSFSYKKGIPVDESGNGGGYVFDCRSTHNPGRYEQYKKITGLDLPVIQFLEEDGEILRFLDSVYKLADFHVQRFIDRGFTNLMFAFGCTGGQHRSVYSAQHLAEHINHKFNVEVHVFHREQNIRQVLNVK